MSLKEEMRRAKEAQSFQGKAETKPTSKGKAAKGKASPQKRAPKPKDKPKTANELAQAKAGVQPAESMTRAERAALRRSKLAQLNVEISIEGKARLIKDAKANGRTLSAEILHRLGEQ